MNIKKYLLLSSVALMAVACQDNKDLIGSKVTPTPGEEIVFGGILELNAGSRTVYGDSTKAGYPISWIMGDRVYIYTPHIKSDRNQALYKVKEDCQAAGAFVKTGEAGIQWGPASEGPARFYSMYPGEYNDKSTPTVDYSQPDPSEPGIVTFNANMTSFQTCKYDKNTFHLDSVDRYAAIMYAKSELVDNGSEVNLQYKPLATGLRMRLWGPEQKGEIATISQIKLIAPEGTAIAGDFKIVFTDDKNSEMPMVVPSSEAGKTTNEITLYTQYGYGASFITLPHGENVDLNFFIIPNTTEEIEITDDWRIEVILAGYPKLTKKLGARTPAKDKNLILKPGMMHRLADLPPIALRGEWDVATWMRYIPRNVYLSEISIPGSWESLNPDFQGKNVTIEDQYKNGCRAFHINCCYQQNKGILGIDDGGPDTEWLLGPDDIYMTSDDNPTFASALQTLADSVKSDEYMVVLCTLRLKAGIPSGHNWMTDISTACSSISQIYNANDSDPKKKLSPSTTVGDVLGKVIVIINCEEDPTTSTSISIPTNSKCLFVYAPEKLEVSDFPTNGAFKHSLIYTGGKSSTNITFNNTQGQVTVYEDPYSTLLRGFAPMAKDTSPYYYTVLHIKSNTANGSRTINGDKLLLESKTNFDATATYAHNIWYYLGLGGYVKRYGRQEMIQHDHIATTLNNWMNSKIQDMMDKASFYPVGIVLMNFASIDELTSSQYSGVAYPQVNGRTTAVNILKLNNRYHKAYDPSKPAFPIIPTEKESNTTTSVSSRAAADGWD